MNVVMLSVIKVNAVMLSVMAPAENVCFSHKNTGNKFTSKALLIMVEPVSRRIFRCLMNNQGPVP